MNIILALVDDRSLAESLRAALPKSDLLLIEMSVSDALRRLISVRPDVILLDDARHLGLEAMHQLTAAAPTAPIVAMLSTGHAETIAAYAMAGARTCLVKPFELEDIEEAIQKCRSGDDVAPPRALPEPETAFSSVAQHQMALRWMSRATTYTEDISKLVESLADALMDIFDPVRAVVLLQANGIVRVAAGHGLTPHLTAALQLGFDQGLMRRLEERPALIDRDRLPRADAGLKELNVLGGRLVLPLLVLGRPAGAVVLGDKASGAEYAREEFDLFTTLARCASTCLERAQRQLDSSRQQTRLDAVLSNISSGVVTIGPDRTITMMNESAERILRLAAVNLLGRSVQKLGSSFADVILRAMRDGKPRLRQRVRDVALRADLGISVTPMGAEGAVAIFSVLEAGGQPADADATVSPLWQYLSSRVAQEIKNPMVAINTFAQLLPTRFESPEFRRDFAEIVQKEVGRINQVVEALYEFAAQPRLQLKRSELNHDVQAVLADFDALLKQKRIKLETRFDAADTPIEVDAGQFARAIRNVIQNSIEAMPDGGTLQVSTRKENGHCEVVVRDTGVGIGEKDADHVFTPFYSTKETGMGLGLTIASRIMKEHEGSLGLVHNPDGSGSFVFHLPVAGNNEQN
jgi:signal transduction histidine kinase/DNA-binding NarL/FixJ family response regulator